MKIESSAKQAAKMIVAVFIFADGGWVEGGGVASCWAEVNDMGWSECMRDGRCPGVSTRASAEESDPKGLKNDVLMRS